MDRYTVQSPQSLFEAMQAFFPDSSKSSLSKWIELGRVAVDGKCVQDKRSQLASGQVVALLDRPKKRLFGNVRILYEDRWFIAIEKPEGLLSVASEDPDEIHAQAILEAHFGPLFAVHRLDREASGLLLFARGKVAEKHFEALFEKRTIKRDYFALVEGAMSRDEGSFESYLLEKRNYDVVSLEGEVGKEIPGAKHAVTRYKVLHRSKIFTYLQIGLETGRKHQIRVHTHAAGHPIVGDLRYGSLTNPIQRLGLHAFRLQFIHPFTQKRVVLFCPLPRAFHKIVPESVREGLKQAQLV